MATRRTGSSGRRRAACIPRTSMARIPDAFIDDLLARTDIVEVVDRRVQLKRRQEVRRRCPFHDEKSPVVHGQPDQAVLSLLRLRRARHLDQFRDGVRRRGIPRRGERTGQERGHGGARGRRSEHAPPTERAGPLRHARSSAPFFRQQLKSSAKAQAYYDARGVSGEIARVRLGYAPGRLAGLDTAFPDYEIAALERRGHGQAERRQRYDKFRDRVMFPIVDMRGNVIGFGGRVIDKRRAQVPELARDPGVLQGPRAVRPVPGARRASRSRRRDRRRGLHGRGRAGAARRRLGRRDARHRHHDRLHAEKLFRQADEVVFCFDGDPAGRGAAWRALEDSLPELTDGKQVRFLFLPRAKTPTATCAATARTVSKPSSSVPCRCRATCSTSSPAQVDLSSAEGRASLVHAAKPLVTKLQKNAFRVQVLRELAERSRLSFDEVEALCGLAGYRAQRSAPAPAPKARAAPHVVEEAFAPDARCAAAGRSGYAGTAQPA